VLVRIRSVVAGTAIVLLFAGCGTSVPPSSSPEPSRSLAPSLSPSPAAPPSPSGPPEATPTSTDPGPSMSPLPPLPGSSPAPGTLPAHAGNVEMAPGPGGDLYVLISAAQNLLSGPASRSELALLDPTGRPRSGWPIVLVGWACDDPNPGTSPWFPLAAADGSVRVVCQADAAPLHSRAFAFDRFGGSMAGWPVDLPGEVWGSQTRLVDDRLYVVAHASGPPDPVTGQYSAAWWLMTVAADGTLRVGTRYEVPDAQNSGSVQIGPDGTGYQVTYVDSATEITAVDLDGARAGWPVRIQGYSSDPVFGPRGRIYVTGALTDPGTTRTLVFDRDGRAVPVGSGVLPIAAMSTWTGAGPGLPATFVAEDGTVFLLSDVGSRTTVFGLDPSGKIMVGWPYRAGVGLQWQGSCPRNVAGCGVSLATPAVGRGDVLYLPQSAPDATTGGSLVAIGPDGRVRPGWPIVLKRPGAAFWSVVIGPDGTAYALAVEPEGGGRYSATILAIAEDGTVRYRTTLVEP
jgi:hypothetical protein